MIPLRFPWIWWAFGWILVAVVSVGSLIPGKYVPDFNITDKAMHASAYFLLMIWFAGLYRRERHWQIALLIFGLGLALDIAQAGTATRHYDLFDVAANSGGILAGFILARYVLAGWCQRIEQLVFS
jgi:VanZ family protein